MNWLNKLERKFGRYAIQNLPLYIVILMAIGTVLNFITQGQIYYDLALNPYMVLHGQVWRLVTFLMADSESLLFLILIMFFYYSIGQSLVQVWGAFRFNMYVFCGALLTIIAAFVMYAIEPSSFIYVDSYYLNLSMFLAYAAIFPNMMVYLYGIIPIKVKWLAYLDLAFLLVNFVSGGMVTRLEIVISLANFLLFFFSSRDYKRVSPKEIHRKQVYKKKVAESTSRPYRHKCSVCGRTELDDPSLEFRFCSKCEGNHEYCNEHLWTHTHVK